MGWSYGGFMTSWAITQTKRFRAASVGAGVTNLMSMVGTSDIPDFVPCYFESEYWQDPAVYAAHSAMFQIGGVTPPLIRMARPTCACPWPGQRQYVALKRHGRARID
jgi:dipeptidyl aminopeptidase/acylaminoacyl peptidase